MTPRIRVGIGYDIHRLVPGRALVLGGVAIPSELGLDGHSDADALLHAIMDALLGAAGLADIGHYFPPDDDRYRNASSLGLLSEVCTAVEGAGLRVVNVDSTVVAERPRIAPYIDGMKQTIAEALGVDVGCVGIKATTNEGLGSLGRREGIAAMAVALLMGQNDRDLEG